MCGSKKDNVHGPGEKLGFCYGVSRQSAVWRFRFEAKIRWIVPHIKKSSRLNKFCADEKHKKEKRGFFEKAFLFLGV